MFEEFRYNKEAIESSSRNHGTNRPSHNIVRKRSPEIETASDQFNTPSLKRHRKKPVKAENNIHSFPPIIQKDKNGKLPHTLILGTMPSEKSLARNLTASDIKLRGGAGPQNYGHPRNSFFNIVGTFCGFHRDETTYEEQISQLVEAGYAVWDVLAKCTREGSLDSKISQASMVPSNIPRLLCDYPSIKRLANSAKIFASPRVFGSWLDTGISGLARDLSRIAFIYDPEGSTAVTTKSVFGSKRCVKSKKEVVKQIGVRFIELVVMPSTSPASAKMRPPEKEKVWHIGCFLLQTPPKSYVCPGCRKYDKDNPNAKKHWFLDCIHYEKWKTERRKLGASKPKGGDSWYY